MRGVRLLKRCGLSVAILALIVSALAVSEVKGFDLFELYPTAEHHVAALNSNMRTRWTIRSLFLDLRKRSLR
jgi:hypothetical protein